MSEPMKWTTELLELVDVITCAMMDWDDYMDECSETETPPIDSIEDFIADGVVSAGYRKLKWIPVTERLPDNPMERVLVKFKDSNSIIGDPDMDTDRYIVDSWVRWGKNVTHWMPLPEPPKED